MHLLAFALLPLLSTVLGLPNERRQAAIDVDDILAITPQLSAVTTAFNLFPAAGSVTVGSALSILSPMILTQTAISTAASSGTLTVPVNHGGKFDTADSQALVAAYSQVGDTLEGAVEGIAAKLPALNQTFQFPSGSGIAFTPGQAVKEILEGWEQGIAGMTGALLDAMTAPEVAQVKTLASGMDSTVKGVIALL